MMPVVLVTGATGLVGRAVVDALGAAGWSVLRCARRLSPGAGLSLDLASPNAAIESSCSTPPNLVVHLAAAIPSPSMPDDDTPAATDSRHGRQRVAGYCRLGLPRHIHVELQPLRSQGCDAQARGRPSCAADSYLAAKREGESKFLDRCDATVLRIPSPVGPGLPPHVVFPRFVAAALAGRSLEVWGAGAREQNFLWTSDAAAAVIAAANAPAKGTYNVAGDRPTTMLELAETVISVVGSGRLMLGEHPDPRDDERRVTTSVPQSESSAGGPK